LTKIITYLVVFCGLLLLGSCDGFGSKGSRKMPSLVETYSKRDKRPFGANIAYRQIEAMYSGNVIRDKRQSFIKTWESISDTAAVYFIVAPGLFVNEEEVDAMMDFVYSGNDLVISAGLFDDLLMKRIHANQLFIRLNFDDMPGNMNNTGAVSVVKPEDRYAYFYYPFQSRFTNIDSSRTKVLGYNDNKEPNSIVYFHGRGRLFLQCEPRALSNYFLLKDNNYQYLQHVMSFTSTQPEHVYWDDYYHKIRYRKKSSTDDNDFSTFGELKKNPPLMYAFWLALILLLLYILFGGKYLQRVIAQRKPNENTTVTFTETIGRLYLQHRDNKNIADKMITYFNEYIRNTYFLNTNHFNDDFVTVLSRKSGLPKEQVDTLYRSIIATQGTASVTDYQLLSLHEQIQNFYKNKK